MAAVCIITNGKLEDSTGMLNIEAMQLFTFDVILFLCTTFSNLKVVLIFMQMNL